jgi:hypothetical protein
VACVLPLVNRHDRKLSTVLEKRFELPNVREVGVDTIPIPGPSLNVIKRSELWSRVIKLGRYCNFSLCSPPSDN